MFGLVPALGAQSIIVLSCDGGYLQREHAPDRSVRGGAGGDRIHYDTTGSLPPWVRYASENIPEYVVLLFDLKNIIVKVHRITPLF